MTEWHRYLKGTVSPRPGMALAAESIVTPRGQEIHLDVSAHTVTDLTGFLGNVREDFSLALPRSALLTTLLLTPGNLNRVQDEAQRTKYNSTDLLIDGAINGLQSRIVVHGPKGDAAVNLQPLH